MSLEDIRRRVLDAFASHNWDEVLRWESRLEDLVAGQEQGTIRAVLFAFAFAYECTEKWDRAGHLWVRCAEVCGALELLSKHLECVSRAGDCFMKCMDFKNAAFWYERARDVSKEHGFVSRESKMCMGLGHVFSKAGRHSEGVEQQRRALAVAQSVGENDASYDRASLERTALRYLVPALCRMDEHFEEAEALFTRLCEGGGTTADCRLWNHFLRGGIQMCKRNFLDATEAFQAAVNVAKNHPEVLEDEHAAGALADAEHHLKICGVGAGGAPSLATVWQMVTTAGVAQDWPEVLRWESRLEELLLMMDTSKNPQTFLIFAAANLGEGQWDKAASLYQRRAQVLGKLERFRDQAADMCMVGDCFVHLEDAKGADKWYQEARKLGAEHGFFESECRASLGLGKVEFYFRERVQEAEDLLRHALTVVDFVEGERMPLEIGIKNELAKVLLREGRHEEAGPLVQRLRELAKRAGADPVEMVWALHLAVEVQARRGDDAQAWTAMQVLPPYPISHPPARGSWNPDPTSHLRHTPHPTVADESLVVCTCSGIDL